MNREKILAIAKRRIYTQFFNWYFSGDHALESVAKCLEKFREFCFLELGNKLTYEEVDFIFSSGVIAMATFCENVC